jgi:hypothetical protein
MHARPVSDEETTATSHPFDRLHGCGCDVVGIAEADGEYRLVTITAVAAGERLFRLEGDEVPAPTRYSIQVGKDVHLDAGSGRHRDEVFAWFFWRFMNHHCEPATMIRGRDVIALRDLVRWEVVTFNYNTTEADMAEPFACHCGNVRCEGSIRGARHLNAQQLERLRPMMASYLFSD